MRKSIYTYAIALALPVIALFTSCEPRALTVDDVFTNANDLSKILADENPEGYTIYTLNEFMDTYMTEQGNFLSDTSQYRTRATNGNGIYLFSIDTIPTNGKGVYIRGRVTTDDFSGNFYKALVIQQIVDGEQQNLRISLDLGSAGGLYQLGQELLIRCNGLAIGRYANQPQLCVPSYNNNIFANKAQEKVGWAPGRIPSAVFRKAVRMIGLPDKSKLQYDTVTLSELYTIIPFKATLTPAGMDVIRKLDGRLITVKNICFTGEYDNYGQIATCTTNHPDQDENADVFAPTTNNVGYPQSRFIKDISANVRLLCSSSEYAKFAYYYLPGADRNGVSDCKNWKGTVTGILGWYADNAKYLTPGDIDGYEWSVTPRGIPGIGIEDIKLTKEVEPGVFEDWSPTEFNPNNYSGSDGE